MKFCREDQIPSKLFPQRREPKSIATKTLFSIQIDQIQTRETGGVFDVAQLQGIRAGFLEYRKDILTTIQPNLRCCAVMIQVVKDSGLEEKANELIGQIKNWLYQNRVVYRELSSSKQAASWVFPKQKPTMCYSRKKRKHIEPNK